MTIQVPTRHPQLREIAVSDVMHHGVLTCPVETPLRDVARMLAAYNVHCVVVFGSAEEHEDGEERPWGIVSDLDLVAAALAGDADDHTAGGAAASPVVFVSVDDTLEHAGQLLTEHQTTHLVAVGRDLAPVGVLSTLDIAGALAELPVHSGPPPAER